mgnify:CR=1 FL=1
MVADFRPVAGQLRDTGFDARKLRGAGLNASALRDVGFNASQLRDAGANARQLREAGFGFCSFEAVASMPGSFVVLSFWLHGRHRRQQLSQIERAGAPAST